jgi:hypothetical protein
MTSNNSLTGYQKGSSILEYAQPNYENSYGKVNQGLSQQHIDRNRNVGFTNPAQAMIWKTPNKLHQDIENI